MIGSHLSIAGNMSNALREAEALGLDCVQVFTKNQQQWNAPPLKKEMIAEWKAEVKRLKWEKRTVSHASYLINIATPDPELWAKSVDLMQEEIERCETLGIPFLVHHPGSHRKTSLGEGTARIARAYVELFKRTKGYATVSCFENTVGGGSSVGGKFEDLAGLRKAVIAATGEEDRVGFCFDTCHAHGAGYDMSSEASAKGVLKEFDRVCGLAHLHVLHMNDSKAKCGSHIDRHEHIGKGTIGLGGFEAVMRHPKLVKRMKIMETPKEEDGERGALDRMNAGVLRGMVK